MSDPIIRVENLGKKYIIGHQQEGRARYVALRDVLANGASRLLKSWGKRESNPAREEFWALKDVSFEVKQGEVIGIIGRNGAGKSTLLKVLSRITEPTTGRISIKGRVASLLEVGTGFHPELTGRENIYLNGAILGMSKAEIKKKFDEIVAFAEVEKFLDTPVKRYSSGMYVRLAFAVAAHLEPEILVVDEVLAVGDVAFQKKCLGKMGDVATKEGRTVLFVSHNMGAISQLTQKCLFLEKGKKAGYNFTQNIINKYLASNRLYSNNRYIYTKKQKDYKKNKKIEFCEISINKHQNEKIEFKILFLVREIVQSVVSVKLTNSQGIAIITVRDTDYEPNLFLKQKGLHVSKFTLPIDFLTPNIYFLTFSLADMVSIRYDFLDSILSFEIPLNTEEKTPEWSREGVIFKQILWQTNYLDISSNLDKKYAV